MKKFGLLCLALISSYSLSGTHSKPQCGSAEHWNDLATLRDFDKLSAGQKSELRLKVVQLVGAALQAHGAMKACSVDSKNFDEQEQCRDEAYAGIAANLERILGCHDLTDYIHHVGYTVVSFDWLKLVTDLRKLASDALVMPDQQQT